MKDKYCSECGKELRIVATSTYDRETGEKIKRLRCPSYSDSIIKSIFGAFYHDDLPIL
jgi:hypothetical protein